MVSNTVKVGSPAFQGDVCIRKLSRKPKALDSREKLKFDKPEQVVLAYGEVTGHMHQILSPGAELFAVNESLKILSLKESATLRHEEHNPIDLDAGYYEIIQQREYFPEGWKQVAD